MTQHEINMSICTFTEDEIDRFSNRDCNEYLEGSFDEDELFKMTHYAKQDLIKQLENIYKQNSI